MHRLELRKPDGRRLWLYSRRPIGSIGPVMGPPTAGGTPNPHLRWHPLRREWIAYAAHRQERTFLPPPEFDPLAPGDDPAHPTELPTGDYDVAVFENLFPTLSARAHDPPALYVDTRPGVGRCEVVVFTRERATALTDLPEERFDLLLQVFGDRTRELARDPALRFVLPFENRGVEVGVTLHHAHGQLYAYPTVPPVPAGMALAEREHFEAEGRSLLERMIEAELADGRRVLHVGEHAVAFVPVCARYPYEVWVAPRRPVAWFHELDEAQRRELGRALRQVLLRYDRLWGRPFPYVMAWYQAPLREAHPGAHLHMELWPAYRRRDRLKYLAGTELAAGFFASDALPEEKAEELRAVDAEAAR